MRLMLIGNPDIEHVGSHFKTAASELAIETTFVDVRRASAGPALMNKVNWWLRGRRPNRLSQFSSDIVGLCQEQKPDLLLTTGFAPVTVGDLRKIGAMGIECVNFLTDDPWNRSQAAPWFMEALPHYRHVFSPRTANLDDLRSAGCRSVKYLPFAFAPHVHFPATPLEREGLQLPSDVIFAGGGDADRVPYIGALRKAGFKIALYGGYWDRFSETRGLSRGIAAIATLRKAMASAKLGLCLVRRQNRDGHCMRTFEVPAFGTCMLAERTKEHLNLFGPDDGAVAYFDTVEDMVEKAQWLIKDDSARVRLAAAGTHAVITGRHTYQDRLRFILESAENSVHGAEASPCEASLK
jgi:hypothetical protein